MTEAKSTGVLDLVLTEKGIADEIGRLLSSFPAGVCAIIAGYALHKDHLAIAVIGHVDQGKSSIAGCLTYHLCLERRAKFDSLQYLAKSWSPGETSLGWVTDRVRWKMPRDRGPHHSSEAQLSWLETHRYRVSLFDTPGRRDDVPNAIRGLSACDAAILVVNVAPGYFEAGFSKQGQTREMALLAFSLGVKQIIVAVAGLDTKAVDFGRERFDDVQRELLKFLSHIGFKALSPDKKQALVHFVPVCGMAPYDNIITRSSRISWYTGPTLLEAIDQFVVPKRMLPSAPLRLPLIRRPFTIGQTGPLVLGRVQSGTVRVGQRVSLTPAAGFATVRSLQMHGQTLTQASPGDIVALLLEPERKEDVNRWPSGLVLGDGEQTAATRALAEGKGDSKDDSKGDSKGVVGSGEHKGDRKALDEGSGLPGRVVSMTAQIIMLDVPNRVVAGYQPQLFLAGQRVPCSFRTLISKSRRVDIPGPKDLRSGEAALVELVPATPAHRVREAKQAEMKVKSKAGGGKQKAAALRAESKRLMAAGSSKRVRSRLEGLCAETFAEHPSLGRFVVRDLNRTVAVGVVKSVTLEVTSQQGNKKIQVVRGGSSN